MRFFSFVWACILRTNATRVLDFGAGRGKFFFLNTGETGSLWRRYLQDLRNTGAHVTVCDVDDAVLDHPCAHERVKILPHKRLPFEDGSFDVVVSDHTFEHIEDPAFVAAELVRVLRPGGYICARTPNKYGYVALMARLIPERLHMAVLRRAQPHRQARDVFPTAYKLNTPKQLQRVFSECTVYHYYFSGDPSYSFGSGIIHRAFQVLHWLLPPQLRPIMCAFIRKPTD